MAPGIFALAKPCLLLFFAGGMAEVGGRAANIVDISFKSGKLGQKLRLPQYRFSLRVVIYLP